MVMPTILPQGSRLNPRNTFEVCEGMSIQAAINAAAAQVPAPSATNPWTILIYPGIYTEQITCASYVNLRGVGPSESVIIQQVDADVITLANNVELEWFVVRVTTPTLARTLIKDNGVACIASIKVVTLEITNPAALAHRLFNFTAASAISIIGCYWNIGGTGATVAINNEIAAATILLLSNDATLAINAYHLGSTIAGTWRGGLNRFAGTCGLFNVTLGDILLDNDAKVCTGANSRTGGTVFFRTGGMSTLIVAASNCLSIDAANYVCDGVADDVEIQAAINALTAGRTWVETVKLFGSFTTAAQINLASYTRLDMSEATIKLVDAANVTMFSVSSKTNIEFVGGILDGNKANITGAYNLILLTTSSSIVLQGIELKNSPQKGVNGYQTSDVSIVDCYVHDNGEAATAGGDGVNFNQGATMIRIHHSIFNSNNRNGVWISNNGAAAYAANDIIISGCYASGNGAQNFYVSDNTWGQYATNVAVTNSIAKSSVANDGFLLIRVKKATLSNLIASGNNGDGIVIHDSDGVALNGAVLFNNLGRGLLMTITAGHTNINHIVNGLVVFNNGGGGGGPYSGIELGDVTYTSVQNSLVFDDQGTPTQGWGIKESGAADYNLISGNKVRGNITAQIVKVGANTVVRNNMGYVTENHGSATGTGAQQLVAHGLSFTPTASQIALWDIEIGANAYHSATPDGTNIKVTAIINQDWGWGTVG